MGRMRGCVSVITAVAVLYSANLSVGSRAYAATGSVKYGELETVSSVEMKGKILLPDGKTPAPGMSVRVWDVEQKKFIYNTTTDKEGTYALQKLPPGKYVLVYGDHIRVNLLVVEGTEPVIRFLNVMVPGPVVVIPLWILAAMLAAGAIAGGIAGFSGNGDHDHPMSPFQP